MARNLLIIKQMSLLKKYIIPFLFSLIVFSLVGFYPTDCDNNKNCESISYSESELDSCFYNGIPLHGKVKFVTSFPDIKVKFVTSFPDLEVKFVESFPDECGEWQIVESFPDFTEERRPGIILRAARGREDLTQKDLAGLTGIPQHHISEMENGKRGIGKDRAKKLGEALNTDYRLFL